jgi:hypothetical protein
MNPFQTIVDAQKIYFASGVTRTCGWRKRCNRRSRRISRPPGRNMSSRQQHHPAQRNCRAVDTTSRQMRGVLKKHIFVI